MECVHGKVVALHRLFQQAVKEQPAVAGSLSLEADGVFVWPQAAVDGTKNLDRFESVTTATGAPQ
jgi:hypothetical protein